MDRLLRLADLWSWLPAFRAVAETTHLPSASKQLRVSPSALSRTIHLLERRVGKALFQRVGRRLQLTGEGQALLDALRDSMRRLDDGLDAVSASSGGVAVHIAAAGVFSYLILPVIERLGAQRPTLEFHLHQVPAAEIDSRLLRGQLDIAFLAHPAASRRLRIIELGTASNGIYCGRGHPLFRAPAPTLDQILVHPFAAPIAEAAGPQADNWPPALPRRVCLHIAQLRVAVESCACGRVLAVLPDYVAAVYPRPRDLRRLSPDIIAPTTYYALSRPSLAMGGPAQRVEDAVRACLEESIAGFRGAPRRSRSPRR